MGQDDICRANCTNVLKLIRKRGGMTRRQLEAETGLSWGGVSNTVSRLITAGYLTEKKDVSGAGSGRTPGILEIRSDDLLALGLDVNNTGLTACVINLSGEVLNEFSAEADFSSQAALLDGLTEMILSVFKAFSGKKILAIGISMQGEVDGVNGISVRLPQCPGWQNVPLKRILEEKFGIAVLIGHDPDCMLSTHLSESSHENVVLLRLDKSVGMAAALRGKILYGSGLWEVAHMIVDPNGPTCRCGAKGCLEGYVSRCGIDGSVNEEAISALSEPLAFAARNLTFLFRPDTLILTGHLMKYHHLFFEAFLAAYQETEPCRHVRILTVADAKSAMRGAALLAASHAVNHPEI